MRNGLDASTGAGATVGAAVGVQAPATTVGRRSAAPRTFWRDTLGSLRRQKGALIGLVLIGAVIWIERQRQKIPLWLEGLRARLETWD